MLSGSALGDTTESISALTVNNGGASINLVSDANNSLNFAINVLRR